MDVADDFGRHTADNSMIRYVFGNDCPSSYKTVIANGHTAKDDGA